MEGTVSEIRGFAGPFEPMDWYYCEGQTLIINQFAALYSLLGTRFGGDGRTTFMLPDLRGRTLIHEGEGPGLTPRIFGQYGGVEAVRLTVAQMPEHTHVALTQGGTGSLTGKATAKMFVNNSASDTQEPSDKFLGVAEGGNDFADAKDGSSMLNLGAIEVDTSGLDVDVSGISVQIDDAGSSQLHYNMQPYLVMSFIICVQGYYPQRWD